MIWRRAVRRRAIGPHSVFRVEPITRYGTPRRSKHCQSQNQCRVYENFHCNSPLFVTTREQHTCRATNILKRCECKNRSRWPATDPFSPQMKHMSRQTAMPTNFPVVVAGKVSDTLCLSIIIAPYAAVATADSSYLTHFSNLVVFWMRHGRLAHAGK